MAGQKRHKILWVVTERGTGADVKSFWTRVGIAFENRDGSWSLQFDCLPLNGRVQMRDPKARDEDSGSHSTPPGPSGDENL